MLLRLVLFLCLLAADASAKPNIVLVLADDFSMNLMPRNRGNLSTSMPNLAEMMRDGMVFNNYFVSSSICCPSRASLFTGMMPHNSGVLTNKEPDGGIFSYMRNHNDTKSFAPALQAAGYKTAFMGKYLNGYRAKRSPTPMGWDEWASTDNGYIGFGFTLNHNGAFSTPPDHFTDTISQLGLDWINATPGPFFLELSTFSPHGPFTPPTRYNGAFLDVVMPKTLAYGARPDAAAPEWLQVIPPLRRFAKTNFESGFIRRVQSSNGVDEMIGNLRLKLENLGIADNTYVIFTSDNGYHMGEYSLRAGKETPFDVDINVPFVVVGPGIAPGSRSHALVMNIDLAATFADLAGAVVPATSDGRSMVPLFTGGNGKRTMAVVEHLRVPPDPNDPDATGAATGDPPTYIALRMKGAMYVEYLDGSGVVGYYDLIADPFQLHNIAPTLTAARLAELHAAASANAQCVAAQCRAAQNR